MKPLFINLILIAAMVLHGHVLVKALAHARPLLTGAEITAMVIAVILLYVILAAIAIRTAMMVVYRINDGYWTGGWAEW